MASNFTSTSSQKPQTNKYDPKKLPNESTKASFKENEENKQSTMTSAQDNGVVLTETSIQDSPTTSLTIPSTLSSAPTVPQSVVESIIQQGFPALAKATKPIPASVFSYRFASSNNNQTPYYISSDIVLSGGIAQQTRRRIVHNEVEKRRKDKINGWITKLAEVIPKCAYGKQSKNIVLENAVEYFSETNQKLQLLDESQQNKNRLELENQALQKQVKLLQDQNTKLLALLEENNIPIPDFLKVTSHQTTTTNTTSQSENTCVTWSASENIPSTDTTSVDMEGNSDSIGQTVSDGLSSSGLSTEQMTCCVQQTQPNYSIYTVSSIMNGLSQDQVSLDGSRSAVPITVEAGSHNTNNTSAIPVVMATALGTLNQSVHLSSGAQISAIRGDPSAGLASETILAPTQGCSDTVVPIVQDTSVTQGITQVVLCQGTVPQSSKPLGPPIVNVPNNTLVTPIVMQNTRTISQPCVFGSTTLANNTGGLLIQNQGPVMTIAAPTSSTPAHVIGNNKTVLAKDLVNLSTGINPSLQAPGGMAVINSSPTIRKFTPVTPSSVLNGSPVTMTINKSSGNNSVRVIPVGKITNNFAPSVNPSTVSMATQVVTPRLVSVNVPTVPTGVGTGADGSMTTHQPSFAPGLVSVNVQAVPTGVGSGAVGSITTPTPGIVALKLPKTTLQPVCNTSVTSNSLPTGTTPTVNLTPSPGTAFVIVRSAPSQQAVTYPAIQTQPLPQSASFNCVSVASTKIAPTAIVHPTVPQSQLNTATIQTPFTLISSPAVSGVAPTNIVTPSKRSHANNPVSDSSRPAFKIPKTSNAKKRQTSKSSSSSKAKSFKPRKSSMAVPGNASTLSCPINDASFENRTRETQRNLSNVNICPQDEVLTIQNFSISSLIPSISSQNPTSSIAKTSTPLANDISVNSVTKTQGEGGQRTKTTSQGSSSLRLSHSIDSLTGRREALRQEQTAVHQPPQQQNILSFSTESLLGTGDDFVSSLPSLSGASASNSTFTQHNTFTISSFQDTSGDGTINQNFSNFSAEALISESDLIGISNDSQSTRTNCTQGTQAAKLHPNRTQMFSDFSAESLISSGDLGSGLSYAIDNLISRSDNNDNSIAMATVNPNLLHSTSSNLLQDNLSHSMFTHGTTMPVPKNIGNNDFHNTATHTSSDSANVTFSKYGGFTSPQKQPKEVYSNKFNGATSYSTITTSPTYLKHSVDSITSSQHNAATSGGMFPGGSLGNTLGAPSFNSLYSIDQINSQQYQVAGNPFTMCNNLNRPSFQGPTMGSFA